MKKIKHSLCIVALLAPGIIPTAVSQTVLDNYIKTGLSSNLQLKQQSFDLDRARIDLDRAKALFYPQVGLNAEYTLASGGRTIDVPLADLLNNVYSTLNQVTSSSKFPQVQNQSIQLLPNNFHDTKVELTVPIYNPLLGYNKMIKGELINSQQQRVNQYRRELVFNIRTGYYQYLQACKAVDILNNALATVMESLRFNEKLVKNNAATREVILKARAEVSKVQAALADAGQQQKNAVAYFNFLLNQSLETPITIDSALVGAPAEEITLDVMNVPAQREELQQLKTTEKVLQSNLKLSETYRLPTLGGFYNIGFQGFGYKFNDKQFYQLGGVQLKWNLFSGSDNKLRVKQARIDIDAIQNQYASAEQQLLLQVTTTYNGYRSALTAMHSASDEVTSTREAYRLTQSRYREGQALQIEVIDARTQMTNAEIEYSLRQLAVLNKSAELERVMATYQFPQ